MKRAMKKNKDQKKEKKKKTNAEAKGLFFLAFDVIFLLSLYSFVNKDPSYNYLGIIGYSLAWVTTALFGMGSYFIAFFIGLMSLNYLTGTLLNFKFRTISFLIFLVCSCILLNILAETSPHKIAFLHRRLFVESLYGDSSYLRYNLGGIPFYYIFCDLPAISLKNLLSTAGTVLILSTSAFISFLLFANIQIVPKTKALLFISKNFLKSFLKYLALHLPKKIKAVYFRLFEKEDVVIEPEKTLTIKDHQVPPKELPVKKEVPSKELPKKEKPEPVINQFEKTKLIEKPSYPLVLKNSRSYQMPASSLLSNPPKVDMPLLKKELKKQAEILEETLKSFGINAHVGEINCGPTITSFEVHPSIGVKVQKIKTLENDIALNLQAKSIRIIAPIPGKAAVGVEIPSLHPQPVFLKEMIVHYEQAKRKSAIPLLLGKTVSGEHVVSDLTKMPHLLIAGATGSGKSVCINTIVMSILMNLNPDEIKLMMIDPKKVELTQYSNLPHMIAPVITEAHGAYAALQWLVREMQKRYDILKLLGLRNISAFNGRKPKKDFEESLNIEIPDKMPLIVAIIDEFADLMMVSSTDLETPIARIAQMARAVGIHLILATQRPSREVITGIIKANFPSRIAFKVASRINSQIILDETGADALLGNGDLLFLPPGSSHLVRAQGAYISDEDINTVIAAVCKSAPPSYLIPSFDAMKRPEMEESEAPKDSLYDSALSIVLQTRTASTTFLQRKLKIGYARAASLMDELESNGVIGPQDGSRPRKVLGDMAILEDGEGQV